MDGAGAPFENTSCESFVSAMNKALQTQPQELANAARHLEMRHNWSAVANRVIGALKSHTPQA
jgi:hypothetical protein